MKEVARQLSLVLTERIPAGNMDVWEVVTIGRYPYTGFRGVLSAEDKRICEEALATCRLTELRERIFDTLSDGEKQRVMIARALAQETPLILLDEPTAHLDLPSRLEVTTMLRTLAHKLGKSILISTHELDLALGWADTIWLLDRSGAITAKAPEDLILDGDIERVFGDSRLRFDQERGEFSIAEEPGQQIHLTRRRPTLQLDVPCASPPRLRHHLWRPTAGDQQHHHQRSGLDAPHPLRGSLPSITLSPHSSPPSESAVHLYINQANNV